MVRNIYGNRLDRKHPTSLMLLDETGAISNDRFFAVGLIKSAQPSDLLRAIQKFRDRRHYYREIKFTDITRESVPLHCDLIDEVMAAGGFTFRCFLADRQVADPIERFGDQWQAYAKMAEQLVIGALDYQEVTSVLADNYSTPDHVKFEEDLRDNVNRRTSRLAITSVVRLDSRSSDGLQVVDLFTSSAAFEFRAASGLASSSSPKAHVAQHLRLALGQESLLSGLAVSGHSLKIYGHGSWDPPREP